MTCSKDTCLSASDTSHRQSDCVFFVLPQFQNILTVAELMYRRNTSGATTTLNIECVRTSLIVAANAVHRSIGSLRLLVI